MDKEDLRGIHQEVDKRSYALMRAAEQFADQHDLLSSSQANGLLNVANCVDSPNTLITNYIQRQAGRSTVSDQKFWQDLKREIEGLRKQAEQIQNHLGLSCENQKAQKDRLNQIQLWLARDYIQHLVAHEIYKKGLREGNHDSMA